MTAKATEGPYYWRDFGAGYCLVSGIKGKPIILDSLDCGGLTSLVDGILERLDPNHPDARLFAASWSLKEACKKALTCASMDSSVRALVVAALALSEPEMKSNKKESNDKRN